MKTLGVVGGIGPESAIVYYRTILAAYCERHGEYENPSVLIKSINVNTVLRLLRADDRVGLTEYLVGELQRLSAGGASLGILAASSPHIVLTKSRVYRQSRS